MINAKQELLVFLKDYRLKQKQIKAAHVFFCPNGREGDSCGYYIFLREKYSSADWDEFLRRLDFEYDDENGTQYLDGTIWFKDGTWATREECGDVKWWEYHKCPPLLPCLEPWETSSNYGEGIFTVVTKTIKMGY